KIGFEGDPILTSLHRWQLRASTRISRIARPESADSMETLPFPTLPTMLITGSQTDPVNKSTRASRSERETKRKSDFRFADKSAQSTCVARDVDHDSSS